MKKIKALLSFAVFVLIFLPSCNTKEKSPDFTVLDAPPPTIPDSLGKKMESITNITALQLSADYIANEVKADRNYKSKSFIVTGSIQEITKGIAGDIYIILTGANRQRTILCQFNNEEQAASLQKQQIISLKGTCDGLMGSIVMNNCELVK